MSMIGLKLGLSQRHCAQGRLLGRLGDIHDPGGFGFEGVSGGFNHFFGGLLQN